MELESFISDGIIEKHLLGLATPDEERALQVHLGIFPELVVEMAEMEQRIEKAAFMNAPLPPVQVKRSLMRVIAQEKGTPGNTASKDHYSTVSPAAGHITVHKGWRLVLISLLSLIALSILAAIIFYMATKRT